MPETNPLDHMNPTPREAELIAQYNKALETVASVAAERDSLRTICDNQACELVAHREKARENYWAWQGDGNDHLESLVLHCPVVITAHKLAEIIAERDEARAELAKAKAECGELRSLVSSAKPYREEWLNKESFNEYVTRWEKAMSKDCGVGWRSPEDWAKLEAQCAHMVRVIETASSHDHSDGDEKDCPLCAAVSSVLDKPNPGQALLDRLKAMDEAHASVCRQLHVVQTKSAEQETRLGDATKLLEETKTQYVHPVDATQWIKRRDAWLEGKP